MKDEFLYLWAQWGILNVEQCSQMLRHFGSFEAGWKNMKPDFLKSFGWKQERIERVFKAREQLSFAWMVDTLKQCEVKIYFLEDQDYPSSLKALDNPPPFLFVRGSLPSFHKSISVVGTRAITSYGKLATERLTANLVREGFVIVSGLALGVDSVAHRTTVKNGGITVAVMGTGVDQVYPSGHHRLAQEILQMNGALISSYPLGTPGLPHHFPKRNEIVAGLTRGTLVIEGGIQSGALITAKLALEYGKEVFAVPCDITHLALSGTNHLIRKSAAKLVENIEHILEDFSMKPSLATQVPQDFTSEERLILEKLASEGKNMDQLLEETSFDIPDLSELLIRLSLKGVVTQQSERWVLL